MNSITAMKSPASVQATSTVGRLFILDISGRRLFSTNPDGSNKKVLVNDCRNPDGIAVDLDAGHVYWTDMGVPPINDGAIERANFDGSQRTTIIPQGATFTPKQMCLDTKARKLYWSDREGMRVMRANLDGSNIETLIETGTTVDERRDQRNWCVGVAIDPDRGHLYWTQKGADDANQGRILRANLDLPKGETAARRTDIETLFSDLPEPIDLDLDLVARQIYWTDRGDPPRGNTVNRAPMDAVPGQPRTPIILMTHLMEGIGLTLDLAHRRLFATDLGGSVYCANLDGSNRKALLVVQGNLTGIVYCDVPPQFA